jgi:hypothetical protein
MVGVPKVNVKKEPDHSMSDKDIIIKSLERVERRIRTNRLFNELALGAALFLAFPLALKMWDLFDPFRAATITVIAGTWVLLFAVYVVWRSLRKATLNHAAALIDKVAGLNDEIKTAIWFIHNPRPSEWIDAQVHRAATSAQRINVDVFFPRPVPKTSYLAAVLLLLFIGLNFVPLPWNHNWLALQAAPVFTLTPEETAVLKQTEALLRKAEKLKQPELAQKLEEIVQQLQEGKIDAAQALKMLEALQSQLDEGNLDAAGIREGLEEMAKDLSQSDKLEPTAEAMKNKELNLAADELRKLAEKLGLNTPESSKQMQKSLQQAAEVPRLGLEELARLLKEAAENLQNQDQQGAQEALDEAAQELDNIQEKLESQDLKNLAGQQLQNLQQSLRQRQQASAQQGRRGQQGQGQGQNGQGQKGQRGQQQGDQGEGQQSGAGTEGEPTDQVGQNAQSAAPMPGSANGNGLMPSGAGNGDIPREGAPTSLEVKLQQEKVKGIEDQGREENIEEVSKQERSTLDYRNVKSELSPAQKDLLNQDRIPWEYRPLIKNYFQAIRPPAKK